MKPPAPETHVLDPYGSGVPRGVCFAMWGVRMDPHGSPDEMLSLDCMWDHPILLGCTQEGAPRDFSRGIRLSAWAARELAAVLNRYADLADPERWTPFKSREQLAALVQRIHQRSTDHQPSDRPTGM